MAVIMKRFCCCREAGLRAGTLFVAMLTLVGCLLMITEFIMAAKTIGQKNYRFANGTSERVFIERFGNTTVNYLRVTWSAQLVTVSLYSVQFVVSFLLLYAALKRIRWILKLYLSCTVIIVLWNLSGLVLDVIFAPPIPVIVFSCFMFALLAAVSIYFFLVVYSYSELIKIQQKQSMDESNVTMRPESEENAETGKRFNAVYKRFTNAADETTIEDEIEL